MSKIYPILLAGGAGTRLWPLSRKSYPKQFLKLIGEKTLFQNCALRLTSSNEIKFQQHITLTNSDFRFIIEQQLQEVGIDPGPILIEPEQKNTAAAILTASVFTQSRDENAILIVAPSDHVIPNTDYFHQAIKTGLAHVDDGKIVTFGVKPTYPETGYGYLQLSHGKLDVFGTSELEKFVEKPDINTATQMVSADNYLWNAGIFLFRAQDMISAFEHFAPETLTLVSQSISNASQDLGFIRLSQEPWSHLADISVDYAVMEKARNLVVVPYNYKWTDLGGWDAVWAESNPDPSGNVLTEAAHSIDCTNTLLRSEMMSQQVVGIGLDNIIAIATPDAVLIADKNRSQEVKHAVAVLKKKDIPQAEIFPKDHRPWGWFETVAKGDRFHVKRINVAPGGTLSLQSHVHRSEHWIVVNGSAKVTIDSDKKILNEGQSIYVPKGAKHRLENPTKIPLVLIEVQIGNYFGEDDIVRYEDKYSRTNDDD